MIEVKVIYSPPSGGAAFDIRQLFCQESASKPIKDRNPLKETKFNELLNKITQEAFDEGRRFKKIIKWLAI